MRVCDSCFGVGVGPEDGFVGRRKGGRWAVNLG